MVSAVTLAAFAQNWSTTRLILSAVQVFLAGVFIIAATGKAMRSHQFSRVLRISHLPDSLIGPLTRLVPSVEVVLAASLLLVSGKELLAAFVVAIGLLVAFMIWMLSIISRGLTVSCGCFGGGETNISWWSVLRNFVFATLAALGVIVGWHHGTLLPRLSLWSLAITASVLLVAALLTALYAISSEIVIRLSQVISESPESEGSS